MKCRAALASVLFAGSLLSPIASAPAGTADLAAPAEAAIRWEPVGLSGGGGLFAPAISGADPDLLMLNCDMSAAYISEDGGRSWRMVHHAQLRSDTGCRPGFHPTDRNVVYASSGGSLRVSRDRGRTFAPIGDLREPLRGEIRLDPSDPSVILAGVSGGCRISRDGGATWTACEGPRGKVIAFCFDRTRKGRTMLAATDAGIWRSDDGGSTWAEKMSGLPSKEIGAFAGASDAASGEVLLYCGVPSAVEDGAFRGGIYRSADRGESWEWAMGEGVNRETERADEYAAGPVAQYRILLAADARPRTVYAFNTSTGFHPPHHETVYRSDDAGRTWSAVYYQDPRFKQYNVAPDYVTAPNGQCFKGGGVPFGAAICPSDPERVVLVIDEPHVTHDGGKTWLAGHTSPAPGAKPGPGSAWVCNGLVITTTWNYYVDPFEPSRHTIAYTDLGLARSLDGGKTWILWDKRSWTPWRNTCYEIAFDPEVPGRMWGAFSDVHDIPNDNIISERHRHDLPGGVCVSRDFGATWKAEARGIPARPVTSIVIDPRSPRDARVLYAGVFDSGVYRSDDGGRTWAERSKGLDPANLRVSRVVLHADGTLFAMVCAKRAGAGKPFVAEGTGLHRSRDGGASWEKASASQPLLYPKDFSVHPRDSRRILIGACDAGRGDTSGGLYATEDGGATWRRIGRKGPQTFGGYFHPDHEGWIYMTLTEGAPGAGLWLSRDGGGAWEPFDDLPFSNIQRVALDRRDPARMWVTTFGGSVWRGPIAPEGRS